MSLSQRLKQLGIVLPPVAAPVAAYVPAVKMSQTLVQTSGQLPLAAGNLLFTGKVCQDNVCGASECVTPTQAQQAARQCALNALAAGAQAAGGIDCLTAVVKVTGFVASDPSFSNQAQVLNGASELLGQIFGTSHARSAVGVSVLPLNAPVEVEVLFSCD